MRTLFTFLLLVLFLNFSEAQEVESYKFALTGQADFGFLIGHHPEIERLSYRHFPSFRIYFAHQTSGEKEWHRKYLNPEVGIGFYFSPLTFSKDIGQAYALFVFTNLSLGKNAWHSLRLRFGLGPGYISSKFDPVDNNQNVAISKHFNMFILVELQKEFKLSKKADLIAGIGLVHFSNSGIQMPNLGFNLASVQLGLKYDIGKQELNQNTLTDIDTSKWEQEVVFAYGRKQNEIEKVYSNIYNLRYMATYSLTFKSKLVGSADLFFDIAENTTEDFRKVDDFFQAGVAVGYGLNFEQFELMLQFGIYVYNNNPGYRPYYHRLGVRWFATKHFIVNMSLKTEYARARNIEVGVGWRF
jgi:hypothetical protein